MLTKVTKEVKQLAGKAKDGTPLYATQLMEHLLLTFDLNGIPREVRIVDSPSPQNPAGNPVMLYSTKQKMWALLRHPSDGEPTEEMIMGAMASAEERPKPTITLDTAMPAVTACGGPRTDGGHVFKSGVPDRATRERPPIACATCRLTYDDWMRARVVG